MCKIHSKSDSEKVNRYLLVLHVTAMTQNDIWTIGHAK